MEMKWDNLKGFSRYQINKRGQIRNKFNGRELKGTIHKTGYLKYTLRDDNGNIRIVSAHILVANQYIPNPNNKPIVNHIDENKANPDVNNLEWVASRENANHGTRNRRIAEKKSSLINEYDSSGKYIRTWRSIKYAAVHYGVGVRTMQACVNKETGTSAGRIWRRYDGLIENISPDLSFREKVYVKDLEPDTPIPEKFLYNPDNDETYDDIISSLLTSTRITAKERDKLTKLQSYIHQLEHEIV